ncbi:MAG: 1-deoxy-D-xylulose-5-phosphate reductoisomerase [Ignavibacteriales bacterium]|nr:1-deoxy-D-xylulose-5-phosphate reductoisomerase [Ignavibacteriales bacterium]
MSSSVRNIAILGSTGSIGRNSLEVINNLQGRFRVTYLTTNKNIDLLEKQILQFQPRGVVVLDEPSSSVLKNRVAETVEVLSGEKGLLEIVTRNDVDVVVSSLVGFAGLKPTIEAIKHRKAVALANKETLVAAGEIIMSLVREYGIPLIPIDSEHSAILQCLAGEDRTRVAKLILTASGGPFLHRHKDELHAVTVEQALNHPNWKMGNKITIDSATLMNKGLEVIEAHWLFGLPPEKIDVVIHPQSIIHSMVEFIDGSLKAQLGLPDMKIPIQYALTYPDRFSLNGGRVDFAKLSSMTFFKPDLEKFRCLRLACDALSLGGTAPAAMNAANEVAVEAFLNRRITLNQIPEFIERAISSHKTKTSPDLHDVLEADRSARAFVTSIIK